MPAHFPFAIDSTMLSTFKSCPYKFWLQYCNHWKPKGESVHLIAGGAFASGLEATRKAFYHDGLSADDAVAVGLDKLTQKYGSFEPAFDTPKTLPRMLGALEYYFEMYPLINDTCPPLHLADGGRAIEFSFAIPFGNFTHPELGTPLMICGRADMIAQFAGGIWVVDEKTTTQLGNSWSRQWENRSQFTTYCLTGDTEVLTPEGWVRLDSLKKNTQVMQWSAGQLDFALPTDYHSPRFEGNLHSFSGKVNFTATPDHRVPVYDAYTDSYKTFTLKTLPRNSGALRFISAGFKIDGQKIDENLLRLLVAIQADGSWLRGASGDLLGVRFQFNKPRKAERLLTICAELGLQISTRNAKSYSYRINPCEELNAIEALLGPKKEFGSWLLSFSGESLRVFMDELRHWDGCMNTSLYSTNQAINADWVCTVASLCGMRGSIHTQDGWKTGKPQYRVYYTDTHQHSVHLHQEILKPHSGKVYCLSVPSSYFLIRVNGKISVTGNCWAANQFGIEPAGVLVRGVSILKTKYETAQVLTRRADWEVERWRTLTLQTIEQMLAAWQRVQAGTDPQIAFPLNLDHACAEYGGCSLLTVCKSRDPDEWLPTNYDQRVWDPLSHAETTLEAYNARFEK